ncbi:hypothetical protein Lal_00034005 [Lupinus albus]|nr:hypothetical protein Lal_00034005 [Lupinus albus]
MCKRKIHCRKIIQKVFTWLRHLRIRKKRITRVLQKEYQSWKPRLIQRFSLERERCIWEGEILGYTRGFSPERELYHPGEKWQFWAV